MSYSEQALLEKIKKLNAQKDPIQSLSAWIRYHKKRANASVTTWNKALFDEPDPERKLILIYLANDIIQESRKKGTEFLEEFATVLKQALAHVFSVGTPKIQTSLKHTVTIWEQREVFNKGFLGELKQVVGGQPAKSNNSASVEDCDMRISQPTETNDQLDSLKTAQTLLANKNALDKLSSLLLSSNPIINALHQIEEQAVGVILAKERIETYPDELLSGYTLREASPENTQQIKNKLGEAIKLFTEYKDLLSTQIHHREQYVETLQQALQKQEVQVQVEKTELNQVNEKLQKASQAILLTPLSTENAKADEKQRIEKKAKIETEERDEKPHLEKGE